MNLFKWQFANLTVPMIELEPGHLRCTNKGIEAALGVNASTLRDVYREHADRFTPLSVGKSDAKGFLREHREVFDIQRVRSDTKLWTPRDMLRFARYITSPAADEFHERVIDLIEEQARVGAIAPEEFRALEERVAALTFESIELKELKGRMAVMEDTLGITGSALGKGLQAIGKAKKVH